MPNFGKCRLNLNTRLRKNILKPLFGSERREPKKEWDTNMESFHIDNPFLLNVFPEGMINIFKPFAEKSISLRIIISFESLPIY